MEARAWPTGAPMALPPLARLLGGTPESVEQLLNYGYRAAWKVRLGNDLFVVKADVRAGFQPHEVDVHRHAATSGIPVPEIVGVDDGPPATVAIRWVDGVSLHGQDSAGAWRAAGRTLRLIHGQSTLRPREQPWDEFIFHWFASDVPYLGRHGLTDGEIAAALKRAEGLRSVLAAEPLVWLHGDCQAEHFLMEAESERVLAVLDWADAQEGAAGMDFAVLTLFDEGVLPHLLDGYEADGNFRQRLATTLPLYAAVRAAGAVSWLDAHGYHGFEWPLAVVRRFANGE